MPSSFRTGAERWQAVQSRNPAATNAFVYAVHTTQIYCRPTCPARLARRANVSFFDTPAQAQVAGYRACKRCKPESGDGLPEDAAVKAVREFVENKESLGGKKSLGAMAEKAGLSKWHFHRTFVKVVGITPGEWVKRQRKAPSPDRGTGSLFETSSTIVSRSESTSSGTSRSTKSADSPVTSSEELTSDLDFQISEEEWEKLICFDGMENLGSEFEGRLDWNLGNF